MTQALRPAARSTNSEKRFPSGDDLLLLAMERVTGSTRQKGPATAFGDRHDAYISDHDGQTLDDAPSDAALAAWQCANPLFSNFLAQTEHT